MCVCEGMEMCVCEGMEMCVCEGMEMCVCEGMKMFVCESNGKVYSNCFIWLLIKSFPVISLQMITLLRK